MTGTAGARPRRSSRANRRGGPEGVIDAVEALVPEGFDDVNTILSHGERSAIVMAATGFRPVTEES